jgi:transposase
MEATGVYWKPVLYALERRFTVWLCNARNVKKVPGRKSDLSDAEWLAGVAAHGMICPSFVPPLAIRELRELTRYRKTQIDARVVEIQRLEKVLQDAGVKLTSVASKVLTQSGRSMIEALIAGEHDPAKLAALAKSKMRPKIPALTEALAGHFGPHHGVACRRILGHIDFLDETIVALTEQIDARTATFDAVYKSLLPAPGFDRLTIDVIIAETGADMTRFPTAGDLASRTGVCPGGHESAGKRRQVSTTPGKPMAAPRPDRSGPSRGPNQGQLLRRPIPPDRPPPRPQQGRRRRRAYADRTRLAPAQHRRGLQRSRRRLLHQPPRPRTTSAPSGRPTRTARLRGHARSHPSIAA